MDKKQESGITCVLCTSQTDGTYDIYCTTSNNVTVCSYIFKIGNVDLDGGKCSKYACQSCVQLVHLTEKAEVEYHKHRDLLLDIIRRNPDLIHLREHTDIPPPAHTVCVEYVKVESCKSEPASSEDDEPLAFIKAAIIKEPDISRHNTRTIDDRHFSSDEEFTWKLDKAEDGCLIMENYNKIRKKEHKQDTKDKDPKRKQSPTSEVKNTEYNKTSDKSDNETVNCDLKCDKCNRVFKKKCYYERHSHCTKPYICEVCGKSFKSPKLCNAHILMHQGIADYKCIPCNKLFPTKVAFMRHDKIHNGVPRNQCDQCGKSFIHQSSLRMHKLAHTGIRKHTCDVCGLALLSNSMLIRHRLVHTGEKNYACDICGKKFARNSNMHTHMKTHTKDKPRLSTAPNVPGKRKNVFRCEMCPERFDRLFKLEIHLCDDHKVVLKKGRPKPRNTMKKFQRAQQSAANIVNAIAGTIGVKKETGSSNNITITNLSVSNESKTSNQVSASEKTVSKTSPQHPSTSSLMSNSTPPPTNTCGSVTREYQDPAIIRQIGTTSDMVPPTPFNAEPQYLNRIPDYIQ